MYRRAPGEPRCGEAARDARSPLSGVGEDVGCEGLGGWASLVPPHWRRWREAPEGVRSGPRMTPQPASLTAPQGGRGWRRIRIRPIGRASCRERVCQYVSFLGVAVFIKKKKVIKTKK